ncbi:hypothetical protein ACOMHN_032631 [Nucella lapillus]
MERTVHYEVLESEEEAPAQPVAMAMIVPPAPPPYELEAATGGVGETQPAKLPNYVEATTLPTYEEAERSKLEEGAQQNIDSGSVADLYHLDLETGGSHGAVSEVTIGTDGTFMFSFLISFLFNWLGFLISVCLSNSVAGQCGAISGLGLSIIKWVAIVKQGHWASHLVNGDSWLWWLLFFGGFLLFIRGAVQYVRVKYDRAQSPLNVQPTSRSGCPPGVGHKESEVRVECQEGTCSVSVHPKMLLPEQQK